MLRRCVWSRNIKNGCSIYINDISRLRVKWKSNIAQYGICSIFSFSLTLVGCMSGSACYEKLIPHVRIWFSSLQGGNNSKKEHHQWCNNLFSSLYFLFQKWTGQHETIARISTIRTMHRLGKVSFNTALFMVRPTEILLTVYRLSAGNTSNNRSHINNVTFNPLKTKRRPLYLKTQSVPRCKHFSSRL